MFKQMLTNYNVVNVILSIQASVKTQTIHIEQHTLDSFEKKFRNRNMLKAKTVFLNIFLSRLAPHCCHFMARKIIDMRSQMKNRTLNRA